MKIIELRVSQRRIESLRRRHAYVLNQYAGSEMPWPIENRLDRLMEEISKLSMERRNP